MNELIPRFRDWDDGRAPVELLKRSAELLSLEGRQEQALARIDEALEQSEASERPKMKAALWSGRAQLLMALEQIEAALDAHERSLETWRELEDIDELAAGQHLLGMSLYQLGRLEEAREQLTDALALRRAAGDASGEGETLATLGVVARKQGKTEEAKRYYEQALELLRQTGPASSELSTLINLGFVHRTRGDLQKALEVYTEALPLAEKLGIPRSQHSALSNLGSIHQDLGELDKARDYFDQGLQIARQMDSPREESRSLVLLAGVYEELHQPDRSLELYREVLEQSPEGMKEIRAQAMLGVGRSELLLGRPEAGQASLEGALDLYRQGGFLFGEATTRLALGECHHALGNFTAAIETWQRALQLSRRIESAPLEAESRLQLARVAKDQGRLEEALSQVRVVIALGESVRSRVVNPRFRSSFLSRRQTAYDLQVDLMLRLDERFPAQGWAERALGASERRRARTLLELLETSGPDTSFYSSRSQDVQALLDQLSWTQGRLLEELGQEVPDARKVARLEKQLTEQREALDRAEWKLRSGDGPATPLRTPPPLTLDRARQLLEPGTALLEYALGDERSVLFIVTLGDFRVVDLPPYEEIEPWIDLAREWLRSPSRRNRHRFLQAVRELHQSLIEPAADVLEDIDRLLVVPDRALWLVPFETFVIDEEETYLIERWPVAYAPSVAALAKFGQRASRAERADDAVRFVAFANAVSAATDPSGGPPTVRSLGQLRSGFRPLPAAEIEVQAIGDLFPPSARHLYIGEEANERAVKENPLVSKARLLHFASHGVLNETRPSFSGLLLAKSDGGVDDGLLQVHEIFDLSLSAKMVVLSACETGLGRQVRGEGLVGLSQAFLVAGADSLVVSLWSIEDRSTADLMVSFYRHLNAGTNGLEALRQAKLEVLSSKNRASPYYWAAFVLVGRP